jgi:hypothetical protein
LRYLSRAGLIDGRAGYKIVVMRHAVGFARPDRWSRERPAANSYPWHAVEAHRPPLELDGEVELAVCGAIVQVWGSQDWARVGAGRTACPECVRLTAVVPTPRRQAGADVAMSAPTRDRASGR